jgi:hypothetical protein
MFYQELCREIFNVGNRVFKIRVNDKEPGWMICSEEFCVAAVITSLRERDRWGDRDVDGRIMLGWIFKRLDVGVRTGLGWLRIGIGGGRL